jgi:hypothetical protein
MAPSQGRPWADFGGSPIAALTYSPRLQKGELFGRAGTMWCGAPSHISRPAGKRRDTRPLEFRIGQEPTRSVRESAIHPVKQLVPQKPFGRSGQREPGTPKPQAVSSESVPAGSCIGVTR